MAGPTPSLLISRQGQAQESAFLPALGDVDAAGWAPCLENPCSKAAPAGALRTPLWPDAHITYSPLSNRHHFCCRCSPAPAPGRGADSSRPEVLNPGDPTLGVTYGCDRYGQGPSHSHVHAPPGEALMNRSLPVRAGRQPGLLGNVALPGEGGTAPTLCLSGWESGGCHPGLGAGSRRSNGTEPPPCTSSWEALRGCRGGRQRPRCPTQNLVSFCTSRTESSTCTCR